MFKGFRTIQFTSDLPREKVTELSKNYLSKIGFIHEPVSSGYISIEPSKYNGFFHDTIISAHIHQKENRYSLELEWEATPKWIIVIIGFFFFLVVAAIPFITAYMAQNDVQQKATYLLDQLKQEFEAKQR